MIFFIISFFMGDLYLQTLSDLPGAMFFYFAVAMSFIFYISIRKYWRYGYIPFAFALGLAWSTWYASSLLSWTLPKEWEGRPVLVTGYIASVPVTDAWKTNFIFSTEKIKLGDNVTPVHTRIKLSWRDHFQTLFAGEKWTFLVRLKRIHGTQNPGDFDFESWALQNGLRATGYILSSQNNIWLSHRWYHYPINQLRQLLQQKIQVSMPTSKTAPWLMALIIGERSNISQENWQVLRRTGTNHLMAIAGLHIGILSGLAHIIISWLWRRSSWLTLWCPAPQVGASAALITAIFYSALAGFSIPTQRACVMLTVFILTVLLRRNVSVWHSWALALWFVILLNPLSVLSESFWLSFGTIALIIYGMSGRLAPGGVWWKHGRVQWVIGVGLIPFTLALFQECSLISFFANSIAIPWLGISILPFCFLSSIFLFIAPALGGLFLSIADKSLSFLWMFLTWLSHLPVASWHQAMPGSGLFALTLIGFFLLLLPAGLPGRWMGIVWLMPLIFYKPIRPAQGDFWMTLLDVGQGLSVVIQTKEHTLVYDAGAKYNTHFDLGESVVLPYLYTLDTKQIDGLVISHGDNDHIGGASALLRGLPVLSVKTSVPDKIPSTVTSDCIAGSSWQWDNVRFSFIYPSKDQLHLGNDSSCVLRIDNGDQRVLLTGDIEKYAENSLLKDQSGQLAANVMVAPHHGSKTSGVKEFISAVHPQFVLYATGYRNRYHFPHQRVVAAYEKMNATQLNTVETGAMQFIFKKGKVISPPALYRAAHKRYWSDG